MGLDKDAISRWQKLDQDRDNLRQVGEQYEVKRKQLASQYKGQALTDKLNALRAEMFTQGDARAIANEESAGYYRYQHPQKFGFN